MMTTNSQTVSNVTEQTVENAKKVWRSVDVIKAEWVAEKDPKRLVELTKELNKTVAHNEKVEKREKVKAEKKGKKALNTATLNAIKKVLGDELHVGVALTLNIVEESGTVLFSHSVVIPEPKVEGEDIPECEEVNPPA